MREEREAEIRRLREGARAERERYEAQQQHAEEHDFDAEFADEGAVVGQRRPLKKT